MLIGLLVVCIPFLCSSQTEYVLLGGTQADIQNAINNLNNSNNGFGTITIKGNVLIQQNINIPHGITLNFYTGNKLLISNGVSLDIKGNITNIVAQIFETSELNHKIKIHNQKIYPEWFGNINYQNNSIDHTSFLKKAINTLSSNNGEIAIRSKLAINETLDIPSNITLDFYAGGMLTVKDSVSVNIRGNIKAGKTQIFENEILNHKVRIYNQSVYPEWFGICSYQNPSGNSQDDVPIQKAINSMIAGGKLIFVGNEYLIYNEININTPSIKIKGKGTYSAGNVVASDLVVKDDNISSIFNVSIYGVIISSLNFTKEIKTDKGINANGKAINFVRLDGTKDIDAAVTNCRFTHFKYCIYSEGANIKITDNFFGASYVGIFIKEAQFNPENQELSNIDLNSQTRGFIIDRNRFHSMGGYSKNSSLEGSACIKIRHSGHAYKRIVNGSIVDLPSFEKFTGIGYYNHISNNYSDDCKTFFEGNIDRTKVEGNSIFGSGDTAIKAFGGVYGSISNNLIDGSFTGNPNRLYYFKDVDTDEFPTGHGIHIDYAHFTTIHNNQVLNKRFHGIYIEHSKNSSIQSNTIMNFNRHRYVRSGIDEQDNVAYDGIHILKTQDDDSSTNDTYNIQNVISNNTISITHNKVEARFGIYVGDGDDYNFVKNNFIVSTRLVQPIKIE